MIRSERLPISPSRAEAEQEEEICFANYSRGLSITGGVSVPDDGRRWFPPSLNTRDVKNNSCSNKRLSRKKKGWIKCAQKKGGERLIIKTCRRCRVSMPSQWLAPRFTLHFKLVSEPTFSPSRSFSLDILLPFNCLIVWKKNFRRRTFSNSWNVLFQFIRLSKQRVNTSRSTRWELNQLLVHNRRQTHCKFARDSKMLSANVLQPQ